MTRNETEDTASFDCFEWITSSNSLLPYIEKSIEGRERARILNVGCGTSRIGELLAGSEFADRYVVNVDNDEKALALMRQRWTKRSDTLDGRNLYYFCDYSKDPVVYMDETDTKINLENESFDLVLDKSTMDCLLCTENVASGLIVETMRLLKPSAVYLVLSFRPKEFLEPILEKAFGDWESIEHYSLARQVESLDNQADILSNIEDERDVNIFVCRKRASPQPFCFRREDIDSLIQAANDTWFRLKNPFLTPERAQEIKDAFGDGDLDLRGVYYAIFTEEERSNLDFDFFLEDWEAFLEHRSNLLRDRMTFETAIQFLKEMQ